MPAMENLWRDTRYAAQRLARDWPSRRRRSSSSPSGSAPARPRSAWSTPGSSAGQPFAEPDRLVNVYQNGRETGIPAGTSFPAVSGHRRVRPTCSRHGGDHDGDAGQLPGRRAAAAGASGARHLELSLGAGPRAQSRSLVQRRTRTGRVRIRWPSSATTPGEPARGGSGRAGTHAPSEQRAGHGGRRRPGRPHRLLAAWSRDRLLAVISSIPPQEGSALSPQNARARPAGVAFDGQGAAARRGQRRAGAGGDGRAGGAPGERTIPTRTRAAASRCSKRRRCAPIRRSTPCWCRRRPSC